MRPLLLSLFKQYNRIGYINATGVTKCLIVNPFAEQNISRYVIRQPMPAGIFLNADDFLTAEQLGKKRVIY